MSDGSWKERKEKLKKGEKATDYPPKKKKSKAEDKEIKGEVISEEKKTDQDIIADLMD